MDLGKRTPGLAFDHFPIDGIEGLVRVLPGGFAETAWNGLGGWGWGWLRGRLGWRWVLVPKFVGSGLLLKLAASK